MKTVFILTAAFFSTQCGTQNGLDDNDLNNDGRILVGPPGPMGPRGPQGVPGPAGPAGPAGRIIEAERSCPAGTDEILLGNNLVYCLRPPTDAAGLMSWPVCANECALQNLSLVSFEKIFISCLADTNLFPEAERGEGRWYWLGSAPRGMDGEVGAILSYGPVTGACAYENRFCDVVADFAEDSNMRYCGLASFIKTEPLFRGDMKAALGAHRCLCGTEPR